MRKALFLAPVLLATACDPNTLPAQLVPGREAAYAVAAEAVARRNPVIPVEPVAECITREATRDERTALAAGGNVTDTLDQILLREGTQECLTAGGVPDFGL